MKKLALLALAAAASLALAGCGEDRVRQVIEVSGYSNVTLQGHPWWGCGHGDEFFWNQTFSATAQNGKHVSGVACGGIFKGYTVRVDSVS